MQPPLLNCKQAAEYLCLSKSAFWQKCRAGEIPHIRISARCLRIRQSDLETYINSKFSKQEEAKA